VVSLHACEIWCWTKPTACSTGLHQDIRFLLRRMPERNRQTLLFSAPRSATACWSWPEHERAAEARGQARNHHRRRGRQRIYFPADDEKLRCWACSRAARAPAPWCSSTPRCSPSAVARSLEKAGYRVGVLSGDVPQKKRESLLNRFQKGQLEILVATDVAARGLHIDGISTSTTTTCRSTPKTTCTASAVPRAGEEGDAISFACERYAMGLPDIEAYIEQKIPSEPVTKELLTLPRRNARRPLARKARRTRASARSSVKRAKPAPPKKSVVVVVAVVAAPAVAVASVATVSAAASAVRVARASRAWKASRLQLPRPKVPKPLSPRLRVRRARRVPRAHRKVPWMASASRASAVVVATAVRSRVARACRPTPATAPAR
jgi:ATP-dependent RNA helicase RhlB